MEKTYMQITSGRGPVECCRVVVLVMKKIIEQAQKLGIETKLVEHEDGPNDGCMFSVTLAVKGDNISIMTDEWEGSVLWVAQKNPFRPWHRRKNWFVGVHAFKPLEKAKVNERDITYDTLRASGPGGQNVNKVETEVCKSKGQARASKAQNPVANDGIGQRFRCRHLPLSADVESQVSGLMATGCLLFGAKI